ncbi:alpha/beta hydrolase [Alkalicoccus daliensis]|uniref:Lysophospholipase, alpha-beta hydrolase superfamily n=1 Tax=Alkalicoccus daliensis TaxID=745820 RepID=A0A1H0AFA3_9BACI|nr:alpha/beta hydrolase [Alkalicoccus daliensis]SDN32097.1 Lysophospholipase, alpha-beta hydrolase superfamily [Alkalicoccus daliensis]
MNEFSWITALKESQMDFSIRDPHLRNQPVQQYLAFYNFDITLFDSYQCGFVSNEYSPLYIQYFQKNKSAQVVLYIHGYLDHTGGASKTINFLLKEGYSVLALDLPGHGLSPGESGSIASFNEYVEAVETAYKIAEDFAAGAPVSGVGHSTGAAVLFHAACKNNYSFKKLILVAPLYLPYRWKSTKGFIKAAGKVFSRQKRRFKKNSNDKLYNQFIKNDPLQGKWLQLEWTKALEFWQKDIFNCSVYEGEVIILQGTKDTTVEWKKNLEFFRKKGANVDITVFPGARHQLLNESQVHREKAEQLIKESLG